MIPRDRTFSEAAPGMKLSEGKTSRMDQGNGLEPRNCLSNMRFLKGFESSASLDETASNSSMASSSFSVTSDLSLLDSEEGSHVHSLRSVHTDMAFKDESLSTHHGPLSASIAKEYNIQPPYRRRRLHSQVLIEILSLNRKQFIWEESEDQLFIHLNGNFNCFEVCKDCHFQLTSHPDGKLPSIRSSELVLSLAYLTQNGYRDMAIHDEHIARVAHFLSESRHPHDLKLVVVKVLYMLCRVQKEKNFFNGERTLAGFDDLDFTEEQIFEFLICRTSEYDETIVEKLSSEKIALFFEIRAICLRTLELERERIKSVTDTGNNTAVLIATGAKILELGIFKSSELVESQITEAGKKMQDWIDDAKIKKKWRSDSATSKQKDAVAIRALSESTKRASEYASENSKRVAQSTIDKTLSGLNSIGNQLEETSTMTKQLSPENREMIKAAGKVGMASVGAVTVVAEAILETGRSVSSKTIGITADIVDHTCGSVAGDVARDAADTYENVLKTMSNLNVVTNGSKLAKSVAKNVGVNQIDGDVEKAKEIVLKLEKQGAIVAKQTLGIQWNEGMLTNDLICASSLTERTAEKLQMDRVMPAASIRRERNQEFFLGPMGSIEIGTIMELGEESDIKETDVENRTT